MTTKKLTGLFLLTLFFQASFAQDTDADEPQVLVGSRIDNISGFGGFMMDFSSIDGKLGVCTGGGGAVLLNQVFYFGGYGLGSHSETTVDFPFTGTENADLSFSHGGLWVGYIFKPNKLIHYNVSTKFGWGNVHVSDQNAPGNTLLNDNIFALTPQVEGEINIAYWFRINASLGYRLVQGTNNDFYKNGDFSSPAFGISFLFGWFKKY